MIVGCYYRCPIIVEEGDKDHPRFYVLAQLIEYNEIADAIKVKMHDLLGSGEYYQDLFQHNLFFAQAVTRCEACPGGVVEGSWGRGMKKIRFHDLRHSCASLLVAQGVSMKLIQEWLGHSDMGTTANIYSHVDSVSKLYTGNVIGEVLGKSTEE